MDESNLSVTEMYCFYWFVANTCQRMSVRSHMWLRFCHWASKHQHIYWNVATYLPLGLPASTVTQSRCWPLV